MYQVEHPTMHTIEQHVNTFHWPNSVYPGDPMAYWIDRHKELHKQEEHVLSDGSRLRRRKIDHTHVDNIEPSEDLEW